MITEGAEVWVKNVGAAATAKPYIKATVVKTGGGSRLSRGKATANARLDTGESYGNQFDEADVPMDSIDLVHDGPPVEDQCMLVQLSEATLLHNTLLRSKADTPYTWLGPGQIIAMNPCGKQLKSLYDEDARLKYAGDPRPQPEPHPYAMAEDSLNKLRRHRQVAVLVSGESGSGKTESARLLV